MGPATILLVNPHADFSSARGRAIVRRLTKRLRTQRQELGLADIRSLSAPLGINKQAADSLSKIGVPRQTRRKAMQKLAQEYYVTDLGEHAKIGTRLDLSLAQSPFSRESRENLSRVEQAMRANLREGNCPDCQLYSVGVTARVRDLAAVMQRDQRRIDILVLAGVFVILILLLRRFLISLYLLLSVLFSYYTTLGVSFVVFWLLDPQGFTGLDWKVAIFLFTILIGVGANYTIFLMTRIDEEERRRGPVRGITAALDRTGPVISSCGIIMAGTFASLLAGSLTEMKQLGFALAFGILLDTFVVRPILVPAFLILWHRGQLRLPDGTRKDPPHPAGIVHSGVRAKG
jgi:RND superfamily putative drug exporter